MAYASVTYTSASGTTFALTNSSGDPIPYLRQSDISVTVNGVLKTLTTDYTFNTAGTSIVLNTAVSGVSVVIARVTDIADATVTYTAGSTLTAQDLNNADNQIRYGLQEFSDTYGALTTGTGDLSALAGFIGSSETWTSDNAHTATTGAIDNRVDNKITTNNTTVVLRDGSQAMQAALSLGGFKITNLATPTSNTDASTKAYVDSNVGSVSTSATAAAASASAAATSASNASTSASAASASQSAAASSASSASTSASNASTSASSASTSASNASTSATNASTSATSAASSAASALAAFDSFDDRYLGSKASDPTVDNDGDPLNAGDIYFNTTLSIMRVYTGTAWVAAYVPGDAVNISFTPYSTIAATNVQNAVQELTDEKLNLTGGTLTGALVNPLGSAAAPSLTFTGSTNTGLYSPGSGQVAISTNGAGRLFVDASGRVGVGVASPSRQLDVRSTAFFDSNGDGTGTSPSIAIGSTSVGLSYVGGGHLSFTTGSAEKARIDSSGRLGLGTSVPGKKLDIAVSGSGTTLDGINLSNGTATGFIQATGASYSYRGIGSNQIWIGSDGTQLNVGTVQAQNLSFSTNSFTAITIDTSQRVGIGTTGPQKALHVSTPGNANDGAIQLGSSTYYGIIEHDASSTGANIYTVASASGGGHIFKRGSTEQMRLDASSRLLVGTSSSSAEAKFIVQGGTTGAGGGINIQRNATTASAGSTIGFISFTNSSNNVGATLEATGDGTWSAGTSHPTRLVFSTTADGAASPTERMRISQNGVLDTFSSVSSTFLPRSSAAANTSNHLIQGCHSATSTQNGTVSFIVYTNGNVQNTNNSYGAISDIKLKENIVNASSQWDDLKALQVRKYNLKEGQTHTQIGLVAQEAELVSPGLVSESPDRDEEGNDLGTVTKSVNYSVLYMKAVKALQEAMERIEQLESKVAALEGA